MANLSDFFGPGDDAGTTTLEEALPTFGVVSAYQNSIYPCSTVSSRGGVIASGYMFSGSEGWSTFNGQQNTASSIGASSDGGTGWFQATPNNQAEGHYRYTFPTDGWNYSNVIRHYANYPNSNWPYFGTVIGPSGFRQKISIFNNGATVQVHRRGAYTVDTFGMDNGVHLNTSGEPGATSFGMNSYNSRINKLVIVRGNASGQYRLHVWTNPNRNLNTESYNVGDINLFMREAYAGTDGASYFYNDFTWNTTGTTGYNESMYHFRVVVSDNGYVGFARMTPSNQTVSAFIIPNPSSTSNSVSGSLITLGLTTSYGIEQGNSYGMRSNISWDNTAVACYSPYYYYGSGINLHYISTKDASQQTYFQDPNSSWGYGVFPIGKSSFALRYTGDNNDQGSGVYVVQHTPSTMFNTGRTYNGTSWSNGSPVNSATVYLSLDTGYSSTNYVHMGAMNSWTSGIGA